MTEMDAALYVIRRHAGLPEVYGESEVACEAARTYFQRSCGEIERRLAAAGPHLMGEAFSVADLLLMSCLGWAGFAQIRLSEALQTYFAPLTARPAYAAAMSVNFTPESMAALLGDNVSRRER